MFLIKFRPLYKFIFTVGKEWLPLLRGRRGRGPFDTAGRGESPLKSWLLLSYVLYALLLFCNSPLAAQTPIHPVPAFRNFTTDDGLPSSEVYIALEDSRGFMWFGTDNGLVRYDGYEFRVYGVQDGLEDMTIFSLVEGPEGKIWACGINKTVFYWKAETDRFFPYQYNELLLKQEYDKHLLRMTDVKAGPEVWFQGYDLGPFYLDSKGQFHYPIPEKYAGRYNPINESITNATNVNFDNDSIIDVLLQLDLERHAIPIFWGNANQDDITHQDTLFYPGSFALGPVAIYVYSDKDTQWFLRNYGKYCYAYNANNQEVTRFESPLLPPQCILPITQPAAGFLLGRIQGQGLRYYPSVEELIEDRGIPYLENVSVSYAYEDSKGGWWVTTLDRGVFYAANPAIETYDLKKMAEGAACLSLAIVDSTTIYTGYANHNLLRSELATGRVERLNWSRFITARTTPLHFDKQSGRIFGPYYSFAVADNRIQLNGNPYETIPERRFQGGMVIKDIKPYHPDTLLISTLVGPAQYVISERMAPLSRSKTDKKNFRTNAYLITADHQHLVATNTGLYRWENFNTLIKDNLGFPELDVRIEDILALPDSSLLFGTRGQGVVHYRNGEIKVFTADDGLASNNIRHLHLANDSTVWVATLSGISKISFQASEVPRLKVNRIRTFTTAHGLPSNEVHEIKSYRDQVWLASNAGLTKFQEPPPDTISTPPQIRALHLDGASHPLSAAIELPPDQNNAEISFSTLNFGMTGNIPYRYRLLPDTAWQYTRLRSVSYPALPRGPCYFEVQSKNQDGIWSASAGLAIYVQRYWYEWSAVQLLGLLLIIGLIVAYFLTRQRRLESRAALEQQVRELEKAALQAQMNPHFVFNCLNSINKFVLTNQADEASYFLGKFAKLIRQMLNVSTDGGHFLHDEINMLENYLLLEKLRFKGAFDYHIQVDPDLDALGLQVPPLLIQPYLENAILHGLQEIEDGTVTLNFTQSGDQIKITIEDNGKGFDPTQTAVFKSSRGMSITKQRLDLLQNRHRGTHIQVHSNPGQGTRIEISISMLFAEG